MTVSDEELLAEAKDALDYRKLGEDRRLSDVACALLAEDGTIYHGVSIHLCCGIGFCAEHSAISQMVTDGQTRIRKIVAVDRNGNILPPCGRCREFIYEINTDNTDSEIIVGEDETTTLDAIFQHRWMD